MMKKLLAVALFMIAVAIQTPANAAVTLLGVLSPGVLTPPSGSFETFDSHLGLSAFSGVDGGLYSGTGVVVSGSVTNVTSAPWFGNPGKDTTPYLTIGAGLAETINYSTEKSIFGLYWGSVDVYNNISFFLGGNPVGSFTGADLVPLLTADGGQTVFASNRYVGFTGAFDKVVLGSTGFAFEIENIAAGAVPELSTWAMMLIGFASLGFLAYRRSRKNTPLFA